MVHSCAARRRGVILPTSVLQPRHHSAYVALLRVPVAMAVARERSARESAVRALLRLGAQVAIFDDEGSPVSPAAVAGDRGHRDIAELLRVVADAGGWQQAMELPEPAADEGVEAPPSVRDELPEWLAFALQWEARSLFIKIDATASADGL